MKFPYLEVQKFDHHVNHIKKLASQGKYLIQILNFRDVEGIFINRLRWISMMMNDEIEEESDLDQYKHIVEGLTCY